MHMHAVDETEFAILKKINKIKQTTSQWPKNRRRDSNAKARDPPEHVCV